MNNSMLTHHQLNETTSWWNNKLMKHQVDETTTWWNNKLLKQQVDETTSWWNNKLMKKTSIWNKFMKQQQVDKKASWLNVQRGVLFKHYGSVMYGFPNKLVCLWRAIVNTLAYNEICHYSVHYGSVIFTSTSPCGLFYLLLRRKDKKFTLKIIALALSPGDNFVVCHLDAVATKKLVSTF